MKAALHHLWVYADLHVIALSLCLTHGGQAAALLNGCLEGAERIATNARNPCRWPDVNLATRLLHVCPSCFGCVQAADQSNEAQFTMN